jgi:hypothetical protein
MTNRRWGLLERSLASIAFVVAVWGTSGVLQQRSAGQGGYSTGLGALVSDVEEGGPADVAGLRIGDRITGAGNTAFHHPWSKPDKATVGVGNTQTLAVERGEEHLNIDLVWKNLSDAFWRSLWVDFLITSGFLGFGLWAYLASRTFPGLVLALFGVCYGVAAFDGPSVEPLDGGIRFLQYVLSFLSTVLLFHFLMVFPKRKTVFGRRVPGWLVYAPFMPFVLFGLAQWVIFPALVPEYRMVTTVTDLFFMALLVIALIHTWVTLGREELRRTRFNLILWGLAIAIGPNLILGLLGLASPGLTLPGSDFLPVLGVAIPGSMALAVVSGARKDSREPGFGAGGPG